MKKLKLLSLVLFIGVFSCSPFYPVTGYFNEFFYISNFKDPSEMDMDKYGNLYVLDNSETIKKISIDGNVSTILDIKNINIDKTVNYASISTMKIHEDYIYFSVSGIIKRMKINSSEIENIAGKIYKEGYITSKENPTFEEAFLSGISSIDFDNEDNLIVSTLLGNVKKLDFKKRIVQTLQFIKDKKSYIPLFKDNTQLGEQINKLSINQKTKDIFLLTRSRKILKIDENNDISDYSKELCSQNNKQYEKICSNYYSIFTTKNGEIYITDSFKEILYFDSNKKLKGKLDISTILPEPFPFPSKRINEENYDKHLENIIFLDDKRNNIYILVNSLKKIFKIDLKNKGFIK